jgi:TonB family protein
MKVKYIIALVMLFGSNLLLAQIDSTSASPDAQEQEPIDDEEEESEEEEVFEMFAIEEQASYIGPEKTLNRYIVKNVTYPPLAKEQGIEGRVIVQFTVNTDGSVSDVKPIGPRKLGYGLEEEAVRVIKSTSGDWKPATQRDKKVRMVMRVPFMFKLSN